MILLDDSLAERIRQLGQASLQACAEGAAAFPENGSTQLAVGDGIAVYSGDGSPLTQVVAKTLDPEDFEEIEEFYGGRASFWELSVDSYTSAETFNAAAAAGYVGDHFETVMIRQEAPPSSAWDRAITVEEVEGTHPEWRQTAYKGWTDTDEPDQSFDRITDIVASTPRSRFYLARVDGEPAGTATMFSHGGLTALMGGAVPPKFRGRGVQKAMIAKRIADAGPEEQIVMTAIAGTQSYRNAQKAGFAALYSVLVMMRR
jgi:hypothetical protein